jgi:hypothetical protein
VRREESRTHTHVPVAAQQIVDVLAVPRCVWPGAGPEAELGIGDEGGPLVVLLVRAERVAEHETAD